MSVRYGGSPPVLEGLTFGLDRGEVCAMIGPNGAGKSTLLRGMLDIGPVVEGSISVCGRDSRGLSRLERARLMSFLPQEYNHSSRLTALEIVLLGRHPHRAAWEGDSREDLDTAVEAMVLAGVEHVRGRAFCELSGGERRLVMLASAIAQQPSVLLLDEPGSSLDFRHQADLWNLLHSLGSRGVTVLASTHELNTALRFVDKVLVISAGGMAAFGAPDEVCTPELLGCVFGIPLDVARSPDGGWSVHPSVEAGR
ncbi:ABC transporter ATP-binding protein [Candidatus Fermentibacteria bacterium]|nr:ABC transporter ATP-binding protein [Candidatus Fermentibacteria bacterium]